MELPKGQRLYRSQRGSNDEPLTDEQGNKLEGMRVANCEWIRNHHNVIITGPTGIGKSYLAEAFAQKACREGMTAIYYRYPRLFRELAIARGDGSYLKFLNKIAKTELLVIDDWGLSSMNGAERRDFLEVLEDRHGLRSTLITSQYPVSKWFELIGEPTLADAILDRIIHAEGRVNAEKEAKLDASRPLRVI